MLELPLDKATIKTVNKHQYYIFPSPLPHTNQDNRPDPTAFAKTKLPTYYGSGNNGSERLHPDVHGPAHVFMTALLEYGEYINDWSMRSAVIQSGYRPSDASQGAKYLQIIKNTIANPKYPDFKGLHLTPSLEIEAQTELGCQGDSRLSTFMDNVAQLPKPWTPALAKKLFGIVHNAYTPRGCNPHATGYVFDLDFPIVSKGAEVPRLGADVALNGDALQSTAGMWINMYSTFFCFDSYNTGIEVWHMEYRFCAPARIPGAIIPFSD